ncbi:hypothetical protein OG342_07080 [Streptomyces bobili]|uniref:hypothetical protein n=1 Tax=Streptomyces bobili TaxID=67280 RepID=UPI00224CC2C0|nr:hypothetical protein [Streptomyces bobili]MCX5522627.1 hypothetical protein [Streptomyces bobili]
MTTPILTCTGCGATKPEPDGAPTDLFPSAHCGNCPPWTCETCGQTCSATALCPCWISLDGMTTADIKAIFAGDGTFNVNPVSNP